MTTSTKWNRQQLLVAFYLYCQIPFGKMHRNNPDVVKHANMIGRTSSALAMKLTNIASLDPAITSTGRRGLSSVSSLDRSMWEEMQLDWDAFVSEARHAVADLGAVTDLGMVEDQEVEDTTDYSGENRTSQAKVRIGQNFFRKAVLAAYEYRCCMTGLAIPKLLVASHIIPWRFDEKNRLNPRNGLCLNVLHDKAFDTGIITVSSDMKIKVSQKYMEIMDDFFNLSLLSFDGVPIFQPEKFLPRAEFLEFHRNNIFEG
jgi:predicted restriction endonuclease